MSSVEALEGFEEANNGRRPLFDHVFRCHKNLAGHRCVTVRGPIDDRLFGGLQRDHDADGIDEAVDAALADILHGAGTVADHLRGHIRLGHAD